MSAIDPRMFFSWYGADFTTDPAFANTTPELRANPSMSSWGNPGYLEQQRRRTRIDLGSFWCHRFLTRYPG